MKLRDRPLELKFFLLYLVICLVPAIVFLVLFGLGTRLTFEQTKGDELADRIDSIVDRFDRGLLVRINTLRSMCQSSMPPSQIADEAALQTETQIDGAALMTADGSVRPVGQIRALAEQTARWTSYFETLPRADALPRQGRLDDVLLRLPGRIQPRHLLAYAAPLGPENAPSGEAMIFLFDADRMLNQFARVLSDLPEDLIVRGSQGMAIRSPAFLNDAMQSELAARMAEGPIRESNRFALRDGDTALLFAASDSKVMRGLRGRDVQGTMWTFLLHYDMVRFLAPHEQRIWLAILIALGLVLILLFIAWMTSGSLVRPLHVLREAADRVAGGDLSVRADIRSRDEIGALAGAFNLMAERLQHSLRSLEEEVVLNRMRADHIHTMNQLANAIIQAKDINEIFHTLHRELGRIVLYDAVWLALLSDSGRSLRVMQIEPLGMISAFDGGKIPVEGSLHGEVVRRLETVHLEIRPNLKGSAFEHSLLENEGLQSFLIAPLPAKERLMGTLTIASIHAGAYDDEKAEIATSLAAALAIAIEQSELFQQVAQSAAELERTVEERTRDLQQAHAKLIQAEKYYATGRLAGNLAHEINNPLGIIKNYLALVRKSMLGAIGGRRRSDPNLDHLMVIDEEVNRIAGLIRRLLDLHRPVEETVKPVDINSLVENILTLMEPDLKRQEIEVARNLEPELPKPVASADLLRQVFINLLRNSQDAMEEGGRLEILTQTVTLAGPSETRAVRVSIRDTGVGIPPAHMSQIFDPFFTTKSHDKGTGLGLCVSYSIVRMYGGSIDLESRPGAGTRATVLLPLVRRAAGEGQTDLSKGDSPSELASWLDSHEGARPVHEEVNRN